MVISAPAEPAPRDPEPAPARRIADAPFTAFMTMIVPSRNGARVTGRPRRRVGLEEDLSLDRQASPLSALGDGCAPLRAVSGRPGP